MDFLLAPKSEPDPRDADKTITKHVTSIHYIIDIDGHVVKVVDEHYRANHANPGTWNQRRDINAYSVGIETIHTDADPAGQSNFKGCISPFARPRG